jgi:outer membrane protein TolC
MAIRSIIFRLSFLLVALLIFGAQTDSFAADDPEGLVLMAWGANPSVEALLQKIEAANQKIPQAGVWKDPTIAVEYSNVPVNSFVLGDHPMSGLQFKLQQTFPAAGKTDKREKVAAANAQGVKYELAEKKNQIRFMIKRAYWNLTLNRHLRKITKRHIEEVKNLIASVTSRYEIGQAGQHELLRLIVLGERLSDELLEFDKNDVALVAQINTLLSRPSDGKIETPETVVEEKADISYEAAYENALQTRPLIFVLTQQAKAQDLAAKQAAREGWPDPTVWVGYRLREEVENDMGIITDPGTDFFSAGLSFPIPVNNRSRWGAKKAESLAKKRSAQSSRAALADQIRGELEKTYAAWNRSYEKAKTYSQVIYPGQAQALEATLAAYQVGRAGFSSLFDAEVALLNAERALVRAQCDTKLQKANVQALVGGDIPASGDLK